MRINSLFSHIRLNLILVILLIFLPSPLLAESITFTYDELNRLTTATYGNSRIEYTYDSAGNLTQISTPYTLTVIKTGAGTGTVTSDLPGINCGSQCVGVYSLNDSVMLTAVDNAGTFTGWSGEGCSGTGTCTVTIDGVKSVTATFECLDNDNDTYTTCSGDCDDSNPALNPDTLWYQDSDEDGFGNYSLSLEQCTQPVGPPDYVLNKNDYDDSDPNIGAPVKIDSGTIYFYSSLQDAYNAAADGDTIQTIFVTLSESLSANRNISVTLQGGYDGLYTTISGDTILQGDMNINDGTLTIENFILQQ